MASFNSGSVSSFSRTSLEIALADEELAADTLTAPAELEEITLTAPAEEELEEITLAAAEEELAAVTLAAAVEKLADAVPMAVEDLSAEGTSAAPPEEESFAETEKSSSAKIPSGLLSTVETSSPVSDTFFFILVAVNDDGILKT